MESDRAVLEAIALCAIALCRALEARDDAAIASAVARLREALRQAGYIGGPARR